MIQACCQALHSIAFTDVVECNLSVSQTLHQDQLLPRWKLVTRYMPLHAAAYLLRQISAPQRMVQPQAGLFSELQPKQNK